MDEAGEREEESKIENRVRKALTYQEDTKIQVASQQMGDSLTVLS